MSETPKSRPDESNFSAEKAYRAAVLLILLTLLVIAGYQMSSRDTQIPLMEVPTLPAGDYPPIELSDGSEIPMDYLEEIPNGWSWGITSDHDIEGEPFDQSFTIPTAPNKNITVNSWFVNPKGVQDGDHCNASLITTSKTTRDLEADTEYSETQYSEWFCLDPNRTDQKIVVTNPNRTEVHLLTPIQPEE